MAMNGPICSDKVIVDYVSEIIETSKSRLQLLSLASVSVTRDVIGSSVRRFQLEEEKDGGVKEFITSGDIEECTVKNARLTKIDDQEKKKVAELDKINHPGTSKCKVSQSVGIKNMSEPIKSTYIHVEQTLAVIKPDAIDKSDEIEELVLQNGFSILQKRRVHLTPEQTSEFYTEHYGKMFFPSLVAFMSSGEVLAMVLARKNAIAHWRNVIGPTQTAKARDERPDSIRALFGTDNQRNAVHGSDSVEAATREIHFFFPDAIIEPLPSSQEAQDYLAKTVNPTLLIGLTALCKAKPANPLVWLSEWLANNNPNKPRITEVGDYIIQEPED